VQTSSRKISQQFARIEAAEIDAVEVEKTPGVEGRPAAIVVGRARQGRSERSGNRPAGSEQGASVRNSFFSSF